MRTIIISMLALAATAAATQAEAQARREAGARPELGTARAPAYGQRDRYSQPPGRSGIIRWNTPNADGNFGGPGTGGGGHHSTF